MKSALINGLKRDGQGEMDRELFVYQRYGQGAVCISVSKRQTFFSKTQVQANVSVHMYYMSEKVLKCLLNTIEGKLLFSLWLSHILYICS